MGGVEIYFRPYYVLLNVQIDGMKLTTFLNRARHNSSLSESFHCVRFQMQIGLLFFKTQNSI